MFIPLLRSVINERLLSPTKVSPASRQRAAAAWDSAAARRWRPALQRRCPPRAAVRSRQDGAREERAVRGPDEARRELH